MDGDGVRTNPDKISKILNWPVPSSVTHVKGFLNLCTYYKRFIKNFAHMASPMYKLTECSLKPGTPIKWSEEHNVSFENLKKALTETATLPHPIPCHPFILDTDASQTCVGAVLQQDTKIELGEDAFYLVKYNKECKNSNLQPLAFHSQKLTQTQQRYPTQQQELYAIISALHQFRGYIAGSPILVRTDHASLKYFQTQQHANPRLARFLDNIQSFNVLIVY